MDKTKSRCLASVHIDQSFPKNVHIILQIFLNLKTLHESYTTSDWVDQTV